MFNVQKPNQETCKKKKDILQKVYATPLKAGLALVAGTALMYKFARRPIMSNAERDDDMQESKDDTEDL